MDSTQTDLDIPDPSVEYSFEKRFGWYVALNRICQNNIAQHDQVLEKKTIEVLNQLVYLIELGKEEEREMKKAMAKR